MHIAEAQMPEIVCYVNSEVDVPHAIIYRTADRYQKGLWNIYPFLLDFKLHQARVRVKQAILEEPSDRHISVGRWQIARRFNLARLLATASAILRDIELLPQDVV
jgi:hypothetical protein